MLQSRAESLEQPASGDDAPRGAYRKAEIYLALIGILFFVSRVAYAKFLNVAFDATPLAYYVQYLDPRLLQEDLLRSLLNLHSQPPAFNLFLGLVLKAFPQLHDVVPSQRFPESVLIVLVRAAVRDTGRQPGRRTGMIR